MDNRSTFLYHRRTLDRWGDGALKVVAATVVRVQARGTQRGKSAASVPRGDVEVLGPKRLEELPGKTSRESKGARTKTDTGWWGENPKALEITSAKELDRMAP